MGRRTQSRSISLTTVLVSLTALGVVASIGIPLFFARPSVTLKNACELVESEIHATQSRAAWLRRPLRLVFTTTSYRALDSDDRPVLRFSKGPALERSFVEAGIFDGVTIREIDLGGDREIAFSDRGRVDAPGRLVLAFGDATCELSIAAGTGRVSRSWPERR